MDTQRLILFIIFSLSILMLWEAWQRERLPPAAPPAVKQPDLSAPKPGEKLVSNQTGATPPAVAPPAPTGESALLPAGQKILIKTDLMLAEIDSTGADLRGLTLLKHLDSEDTKKPLVLFQNQGGRVYVAQSGLIGHGLPTHKTPFTLTSGATELAGGADQLQVRLSAQGAPGLTVTKQYTFRRGSYVIEVAHEVTNNGATAIQAFSYFQLVRDGNPPKGDSKMVPTYTGVAVFTEEEKFQKVDFSSIDKGKANHPRNADNGWIGILQHYFVAAWLPKDKTQREFYTRRLGDNLYSVGVILPMGAIGPGKRASSSAPLYAGPQEQDKLSALAKGFDLAVDYGWLTVIAVPLFWILSLFYNWVENWGVAIILLTVVIKFLFYPLSAASYKSMARMKLITPRLQKIKEQYGDDRQRLHQAMMDLYKTEKINPLGGCLPILVQIPVFIALYWVLLASVELRHAPFALWIRDLSAPDPYYVLPVIMGITMVIQTRMSPTPPDPIQAKVMQIMPVAFSVFFFFFPAGLVLYWLINNVLSIAQQWQITRAMGQDKPGAHGKR